MEMDAKNSTVGFVAQTDKGGFAMCSDIVSLQMKLAFYDSIHDTRNQNQSVM